MTDVDLLRWALIVLIVLVLLGALVLLVLPCVLLASMWCAVARAARARKEGEK